MWGICSENRGNLKQIEKELKENVRLRVSTAEIFEDTAENPELILESSWDLSQVNREKQGVYKVTGSFVIPEGYEVADSLALPEAYAYLSVQKKENHRLIPTVCQLWICWNFLCYWMDFPQRNAGIYRFIFLRMRELPENR